MNLPPEFEFSQTNLQDYLECRQRFLLRYLKQVAWPALAVDAPQEFERHIQRGMRFHRLAQQALLGLPPERLSHMAAASNDEDLQAWWDNFARFMPEVLDGDRYIEHALGMPFAGSRLVAKYDLLVVRPGNRVTIYDWKTSRKVPTRASLAARLQTRLYPFLLVQAGSHLNRGASIIPAQVEMIYWFASEPAQPLRFPYNQVQYELDQAFLAGLVHEVQSLSEGSFDLTPETDRCRFCVYRSLCDRGAEAGSQEDYDQEPETSSPLDFDFDQIAEVKF